MPLLTKTKTNVKIPKIVKETKTMSGSNDEELPPSELGTKE